MTCTLFPPKPLKFGKPFSDSNENLMELTTITLKSVCALIHVTYVDGSQGHGTGFLFSNKYFLLTCAHYLQNVKSIQVQTTEGSEEAKIIVIDDNFDIAVIALVEYENQTHSHRYLKFALTYGLPRLHVFLGGVQSNLEFQMTEGTISNEMFSRGVIRIVDCTSDLVMPGEPVVAKYYDNCVGVYTAQGERLVPNRILFTFFSRHPQLPSLTVHPFGNV